MKKALSFFQGLFQRIFGTLISTFKDWDWIKESGTVDNVPAPGIQENPVVFSRIKPNSKNLSILRRKYKNYLRITGQIKKNVNVRRPVLLPSPFEIAKRAAIHGLKPFIMDDPSGEGPDLVKFHSSGRWQAHKEYDGVKGRVAGFMANGVDLDKWDSFCKIVKMGGRPKVGSRKFEFVLPSGEVVTQ